MKKNTILTINFYSMKNDKTIDNPIRRNMVKKILQLFVILFSGGAVRLNNTLYIIFGSSFKDIVNKK